MTPPAIRRASVRTLLALVLVWVMAASAAAQSNGQAEYDLVVVGAGPGGLVTALSAMKKLRAERPGKQPRVLVVEKRGDLPANGNRAKTAFSRQQILGVKPEIAAQLHDLGVSLGHRQASVLQVERAPRARGPLRGQQITKTELTSYTIGIGDLQSELVAAARREGIEMQFDSALEGLRGTPNSRVDLELRQSSGKARQIRSRWVVGADGAGSKTRDLSGVRLAAEEPQGVMVGVWFGGVEGKNRIFYQRGKPRGKSGVLIGESKQLYGLFALPPDLGDAVRTAQQQGGPLPPRLQTRVMNHATRIARSLLPPGEARTLKANTMQPFPISLRRATAAISKRNKVLLIGDAMRTVNPYTGSGANKAMLDGLDAARAVVDAELTRSWSGKRRILQNFNRRIQARSREAHDDSRAYARTFASPHTKVRLMTRSGAHRFMRASLNPNSPRRATVRTPASQRSAQQRARPRRTILRRAR